MPQLGVQLLVLPDDAHRFDPVGGVTHIMGDTGESMRVH